MKIYFLANKLFRNIFDWQPIYRKIILISADLLLIIFCFITLAFLKSDFSLDRYFINSESFYFLFLVLFISLIMYVITGQYNALTKYTQSLMVYKLAIRNYLILCISNLISLIFFPKSLTMSNLFILWLLMTTSISFFRFILRDFIRIIQQPKSNLPNVIIYGAGDAGGQLAASLRVAKDFKVHAFIDDDRGIWNRTLFGIKILSPKKLEDFKKKIDYVLLAIPSLLPRRKLEIINFLKANGFKVLQIPSINDLKTGRAKIDKLRPISIDDLLCRDSVLPDKDLLNSSILKSVICITGAAGSIGSELCRQILYIKPEKLVIIDHSEVDLYRVDKELKSLKIDKTAIVTVLGNVSDEGFLKRIFQLHKIKLIFHAAAYKHVPLVEENPLAGIGNNILSTKAVCEAAINSNCHHVVLISSDKAVRPSNIMGATKRFSEIIVQAYANEIQKKNIKILFSMVRFGNVLASSGSVVPLFQNQISNGGPITITHKQITRFFMTITEAAQLLMQSVPLSEGGDVFLLDMGEPVKIIDLAKQMIKLAGLQLKDEKNPNGDIEIIFTGLRKGEKLYEELLISAESELTKHPRIFKAKEEFIPYDQILEKIDILKKSLYLNDVKSSLRVLSEVVPEWSNKL